jgi:anti-anti-sigma factor
VLDIDVLSDGPPGTARVRLAGELDLATAPALEAFLHNCQRQARIVVLDLREVSFIDLAGSRAIVGATLRARRARRRLVLLRAPPEVHRIFVLAGSEDTIEVADGEELPEVVDFTAFAYGRAG